MDVSNFAALSQKLSKTRSIVAPSTKKEELCEPLALHTVSIATPSSPPSSEQVLPKVVSSDSLSFDRASLIPALNIRTCQGNDTYIALTPDVPKRMPIKSVGTVREMYRNMRKEADSASMQKHRRNVNKLRTSLNSLENTPKMSIVTNASIAEVEEPDICQKANVQNIIADLHYGRVHITF